MGPKNSCVKNGPTNFPTVFVFSHDGHFGLGGGGGFGGGVPPFWFLILVKTPLGGWGGGALLLRLSAVLIHPWPPSHCRASHAPEPCGVGERVGGGGCGCGCGGGAPGSAIVRWEGPVPHKRGAPSVAGWSNGLVPVRRACQTVAALPFPCSSRPNSSRGSDSSRPAASSTSAQQTHRTPAVVHPPRRSGGGGGGGVSGSCFSVVAEGAPSDTAGVARRLGPRPPPPPPPCASTPAVPKVQAKQRANAHPRV